MLIKNSSARWFYHRARFSLFVVVAFCLSEATLAAPNTVKLTLQAATQKTLQHNPTLSIFEWRGRALDGERDNAAQAPGYEIGLETENILGSGEFSDFDNAEITLTLSSVIELGGKQLARTTAVDARSALITAEKHAAALDLLGDVTRAFITTLSLQEKLKLATDATALAKTTYQQVRQRAQRGAVTQADVLRAKAALASAHLQQAKLAAMFASNKVVLASHWGDTKPTFDHLAGDLFAFSAVEPFALLYERVTSTPALNVLANKQRIRDAELALARSQSDADLRWQIGIKQVESSGDNAFSVGLSMPLFNERRNRGAVKAADAAAQQVRYHKAATLLSMRARLFKAYTHRQQQFATVQQLRDDILPTLSEALSHTQAAYEGGRYSYFDWVSAQQETLAARQALIDAATSVLLNQNLIEQLTAQPLKSL